MATQSHASVSSIRAAVSHVINAVILPFLLGRTFFGLNSCIQYHVATQILSSNGLIVFDEFPRLNPRK
ncbi:MAG: hypothetical protein WBE61_01185 [Nitrososphaeraceae archaeon]